MTTRKPLKALIVILLAAGVLCAQPALGTASVDKSLERLTHFGSVLMIAAHPDDETNAVLAYLSLGRGMRTAYLSLTRGEGGQNLIGPEKGAQLGLIRTQELLAGRRIDGGEQYFTRAIDFGFSKTADETIATWGHDEVVSDITWVIRRFRPDVVILRWSGTPADGHGHHQASAILGREAITAAADPKRYPEQLQFVDAWKTPRVVQSVGFGRGGRTEPVAGAIPLDTGRFDPVLGRSYNELAGVIRSLHRSQGQGTPERRGAAMSYVRNLGPETNLKDLFEGLDLSWKRLAGGEAVGALLEKAAKEYRPDAPEAIVPLLLEARARLAKIARVDAQRRLHELDEAIAQATGLWVDVTAPPAEIPGSNASRQITVLNRSKIQMQLTAVAGELVAASDLPFNTPVTQTQTVPVRADAPPSQPYWLRDPPHGALYTVREQQLRGVAEPLPESEMNVTVRVNGTDISLARPIWNRYVDEVYGEMTRPSIVEPRVTVRIADDPIIFGGPAAKRITAEVHASSDAQSGSVRILVPSGWTVKPESQPYSIAKSGEIETVRFEVTPPAAAAKVEVRAVARTSAGAEIASSETVISYPHIPRQTVFEEASSTVVRADVAVEARRIGYVMGAGDEVPDALRQMGCDVTLLGQADLAEGDLSRFDAIVLGVRAYNVRGDLRAVKDRMLEYVNSGGTIVVQYNTLSGMHGVDAPYPITLGNQRVTVEDSPVTFADRGNPVLQRPNEITPADFAGWVQERGLYFASTWDPHYAAPLEMVDPGEKPSRGSMLIARYGKGAYVYTSLSFFRQLPAGVPGAYRVFANLVSAGKTIH
jgi:LmbE family N-acetylglucosaminyl deacetylase